MAGKAKVSISGIRLESLRVSRPLAGLESEKTVRFGHGTELEIGERTGAIVRVRLKEKAGFEPAGPFLVETVIGAECTVEGDISDEELLERVDRLGSGMYSFGTYVTALATHLLMGTPVIVPPFKNDYHVDIDTARLVNRDTGSDATEDRETRSGGPD